MFLPFGPDFPLGRYIPGPCLLFALREMVYVPAIRTGLPSRPINPRPLSPFTLREMAYVPAIRTGLPSRPILTRPLSPFTSEEMVYVPTIRTGLPSLLFALTRWFEPITLPPYTYSANMCYIALYFFRALRP